MKFPLALHLLLLTILQLYHLPPPPTSNSSCLFARCQPLYASCRTVLLYFTRYHTVRLKMFYFFMCYLCEKYYKPVTVQYYIANCVSCVPRLTLLYLRTHSQNGTRSYVGDLTVFNDVQQITPKHSSLKQQTFITSVSMSQESRCSLAGCLWLKDSHEVA